MRRRAREILRGNRRVHGRKDRRERRVGVALRDADARELDAACLAGGIERQTLLRGSDRLGGVSRVELRLGEERESFGRGAAPS